MSDDTYVHTPSDPPPAPRAEMGTAAKVALTVALMLGAGFGGFAVSQVVTSALSSPSTATYASQFMPASDQSNGSLAASTPSAPASPTRHPCPNMGSHGSSSGSSSTSLTAY
jgi:hypothetical protein